MSDITITYVVLGAVVVLFVWGIVPVDLVAMGAALSLWATGVTELNQALGGFGDPTVAFIAALFVVSEGLDASGLTTWVGQELVRRTGSDARRLTLLTMIPVAGMSALITINGAVAALLPVVVVLAVRLRRPPSKMLLPLAFGAHAGQLLTLSGSPVNVIVSDAAVTGGEPAFSYFSYAIVGLPLVVGTILIVLFFGDRLLGADPGLDAVRPQPARSHAAQRLPARRPLAGPQPARRIDVDRHGHPRSRARRVSRRLRDRSPREARCGRRRAASGRRRAGAARARRRGDAAGHRDDLEPEGDTTVDDVKPTLFRSDQGAAEVIVPPRSSLVGTVAYPGMVTDSGDLVVLAVQRYGRDLDYHATLAAGDMLLLEGTWSALDRHLDDASVLTVHDPSVVRRQTAPLGPNARWTMLILGAMIVLLAFSLVPAAVAALLAAGALILTRVVIEDAYRSISWTTVILVGAMIPMSGAMVQTGAAEQLADGLVAVVGDHGSYLLLVAVFVLTAVLGQLISNTATALIVIPIAISAAAQVGVSPRPVLMTVVVAAAASFLTPVAMPVNLMVMEPAGYRFTDYWKLGLPLMVLFLVVSVAVIPLAWPFSP